MGKLEEDEAVYIRSTTIAQDMAENYAQNKAGPKIESEIPKPFRKYAQVFSEEEARQFPLNREPNAVIDLLPGAPETINCKVYPLTGPEVETLKKFLADELEKGYISEVASPYTSPVFFIAKKNSPEKQLVIDYR